MFYSYHLCDFIHSIYPFYLLFLFLPSKLLMCNTSAKNNNKKRIRICFFRQYSEKKSVSCWFQTNSTSALEIIFEEGYNFFTYPWRRQCILITNHWNRARKIFNVWNTYLLTFAFHDLQVKLRWKLHPVIASMLQYHLITVSFSWFVCPFLGLLVCCLIYTSNPYFICKLYAFKLQIKNCVRKATVGEKNSHISKSYI